MVEISNVKVYDIEESVIAAKYAMRTGLAEYSKEEFEKSLPRAKKLANAQSGSGHQTFLCGIRVAFDIKYPNYFSPELQRYHFLDIVTSTSKMHRLLSMDIDGACNKYVSQAVVDQVRQNVQAYNHIMEREWKDDTTMTFMLRHENIVAKTKEMALYYAFMRVVSDCPQGIELFMRCTTNYLQLKTIYHQRKCHKLKEDWQIGFCQNFIEKLPYAKEFIIGQ